jgi:hypothetical protein
MLVEPPRQSSLRERLMAVPPGPSCVVSIVDHAATAIPSKMIML